MSSCFQHKGRLLTALLFKWLTILALLSVSLSKIVHTSSLTDDKQIANLEKIFDFEHFKQIFDKKYSSVQEDLARRTYFTARAIKVFIVCQRYRYRQVSSYFALNPMSDLSPLEVDRMKNWRRVYDEKPKQTEPDVEFELKELVRQQAGEPGYQNLLDLIEHRSKEPVFEALQREVNSFSTSDGLKRLPVVCRKGAAVKLGLGLRRLPLSELIKTNNKGQATSNKSRRSSPTNQVGNNPNYRPPEHMTMGLNEDGLEDVELWTVRRPKRQRRVNSERRRQIEINADKTSKICPETTDYEYEEQLPDEIFFDHRDSGCLSEPRAQGLCGSCYAFASIAIMEWLYCMKRGGTLMEFSEQYMVDCGWQRFNDSMLGCDGALDDAVPKFIHNFGVELRDHYPYAKKRQQCPYDAETSPSSMGYIRMELGNFVDIPAERWPDYLKHGPLYVGIATSDDFIDYGGGVHDGSDCGQIPNHAMVLVGHGREDGEEYWLIRNSYSTEWGAEGYYKLAKGAPKRCIQNQSAFAFGSQNGIEYKFRPHINRVQEEATTIGSGRRRASRRGRCKQSEACQDDNEDHDGGYGTSDD